MEIRVDQLFHMFPVIHGIDRIHRDIHMRILHPRIFPVDQVDPVIYKQEIIRNRVDMGQRPFLLLAVDIPL